MSANPQGPWEVMVVSASGVITTAGVGGFIKAFGLTVTTTAGSAQLMNGGTSGTAGPKLALDAATALGSISSGDIGPIRFDTDIYCNIVGAGAEAWVVYNEDVS